MRPVVQLLSDLTEGACFFLVFFVALWADGTVWIVDPPGCASVHFSSC